MGHVVHIVFLPQAPEHAAGLAVKLGGVGTHQIGQEQQVVAAPLEQDFVHFAVVNVAHAGAVKPLQTYAAALRYGEHDVSVGDKAVVHGDAAVPGGGFGGHGGQSHHRAGGQSDAAHLGVACADHAGEVVQSTMIDQSGAVQTGGVGGFNGQTAGHGAGFCQRGQAVGGDADSIQHLLPPALFKDVEAEGKGGNGHIRLTHAGELIDDVVLQQHELIGSGEHVGAVFLQPQNLGGGPGGQHGLLAGDPLAQVGGELGGQPGALVLRPLVHPADDICQGAALLVHGHKGLRLTGEGDVSHGFDAVGGHQFGDQTGQPGEIQLCIKLHKAVVPDILHRAAAHVDTLQVPVIDRSFHIGAA